MKIIERNESKKEKYNIIIRIKTKRKTIQTDIEREKKLKPNNKLFYFSLLFF